jgi:hypothetical protein
MNDLVPADTLKEHPSGGRSGSPGGRPLGSKNRAKVLSERIFAKDFKKICDKVVKAALEDSDMVACRMVLDRLSPIPRGRRLAFNMPTGLGLAGLAVAYDAVLAAIGAGAITVDEGAGISAIIEKQAKILEVDELQRRVAALEAKGAK